MSAGKSTRSDRVFLRTAIALTLVAATASLVGGCASTQSTSTLQQALAEYEAGRYPISQRHAEETMHRSRGLERDQAAYLAGLCAYRDSRPEEAAPHFQSAAASSDVTLAARSKAMLGLVRLDQDRPEEASALLREAAPALDGRDARYASRYAALAYAAMGATADAHDWQDRSGYADHEAGVFTLQVGAFQHLSKADRAAHEAAGPAAEAGLGPVRVIKGLNRTEQPLFLVQIGRFSSRNTAASVRSRIGRLDYIVVPGASGAVIETVEP